MQKSLSRAFHRLRLGRSGADRLCAPSSFISWSCTTAGPPGTLHHHPTCSSAFSSRTVSEDWCCWSGQRRSDASNNNAGRPGGLGNVRTAPIISPDSLPSKLACLHRFLMPIYRRPCDSRSLEHYLIREIDVEAGGVEH